MADFDLDSTRSSNIGEWETTSAREPSFLSIWATDGRDHRDTTARNDNLESRVAAICTRLPPPPIPPWLESSPERLRHFVSNYSCWEKYTELCSVHIPYLQSSSRTQLENDQLDQEATMSSFLPFLAAITVGLLMVGVIAGAYFWHQRKRRKFSFTAKYLKQPSPTRDYCSPNFYMTPSVTVETQLSLCALVDDNFRIQPYSAYREDAWPYNVMDTSNSTKSRYVGDSNVYETLPSSSRLRKENEILLQPDQLDDSEQEQFYTPPQTLCSNTPLNSSRSLPIENSKGKIKSKGQTHHQLSPKKRKDKQKQRQIPILLESSNSNSPYIQIQSLHDFPDSSYSNESSSQTPALHQTEKSHSNRSKGGVIMKKCKDAGNKVISKFPWKNGFTKPTTQPITRPASNRRFERPIRALRQSMKGLRGSISHRRLNYQSPHKARDGHSRMVSPSSDDDHS